MLIPCIFLPNKQLTMNHKSVLCIHIPCRKQVIYTKARILKIFTEIVVVTDICYLQINLLTYTLFMKS